MSRSHHARAPRRGQHELVSAWNAKHPIGTAVRFWPGVKEGDGRLGATRSEAYVDSAGQAVVFITDYAGYVALSHVEAVS